MKKKNLSHYWLCALAGCLTATWTIFIHEHNFEFFWPFNWPVKITDVQCKPVTIDVVADPTPTPDNKPSYCSHNFPKIKVGDWVKVPRSDFTNHIETWGKVVKINPFDEYIYGIRVRYDNEKLNPDPNKTTAEKGNNWEDFECYEVLDVARYDLTAKP